MTRQPDNMESPTRAGARPVTSLGNARAPSVKGYGEPCLPRDPKERQGLVDFMTGALGMPEKAAKQTLETMDIAARTRIEMEMAKRRRRSGHEFEYDPYKVNFPRVSNQGNKP